MWCLRARGASHNDRLSTQHIIYQSVRYEQIVNYQANEQTPTLIVRRLSGVSAWNTCFNGIRVWCCYCTLHSAQCVWSSSNSIHNEPPMFESCSELMPNCKREHKSGMRKFFSSIFSLSLSLRPNYARMSMERTNAFTIIIVIILLIFYYMRLVCSILIWFLCSSIGEHRRNHCLNASQAHTHTRVLTSFSSLTHSWHEELALQISTKMNLPCKTM